MAYEDEALGWDSEYVYEGEPDFEPVPPGTYTFEVVKLERQMHNGSAKMGPCPVAKVEVKLVDAPREAHVFERFFLHKKTMWKVVQFFTSVGLFSGRKGDTFKPDWNAIFGLCGRAEVGTREYKGKVYNEVSKWLEPPQPQARAQPAYAQPAYTAQPQAAYAPQQAYAQPALPVQQAAPAPQPAPRPPIPAPPQFQPGSF